MSQLSFSEYLTSREGVHDLFKNRAVPAAWEVVFSQRPMSGDFDYYKADGYHLLKSGDDYSALVGIAAIAIAHYNQWVTHDAPAPSFDEFRKYFFATGEALPHEVARYPWYHHLTEPREFPFDRMPDDAGDYRYDEDDPAQMAVLAHVRARRARFGEVVRQLRTYASSDAELQKAMAISVEVRLDA